MLILMIMIFSLGIKIVTSEQNFLNHLKLALFKSVFTTCLFYFFSNLRPCKWFIHRPGDLHKAKVRSDEEGVRAVCALRLRDRGRHLQLAQQAVPVRQLRYGQDLAQIHRWDVRT